MTTTYELYTNENGTPKAVEGKAPAIIERVEALETDVTGLDTALAGKAPMSHTHTIANVTGLQVDLTAIRESITNVSSKVDGIGDTLSLAKKQTILDACDQAMNGANPVHAGDPALDDIKSALATIQAQLGLLGSGRYVMWTGKSSDGNSWYRKWSDGWIEQGGIIAKVSTKDWHSVTITFPKAFKNTNYTALATSGYLGGSEVWGAEITKKTTSSFSVICVAYNIDASWYACGY